MTHSAATILPLIFAGLMGFSILVYVILDGFDLGVGILFAGTDDAERDIMVAAIGPFWDANETWLVLAIGLLLVAFPAAHGVVLSTLYIPVVIMLISLILRGVAFDFRAKVDLHVKPRWNFAFYAGSITASMAQGYMLGVYILGLDQSWTGVLFGLLVGLCLTASYAAIGAAWIIHKTEGALQHKAVLLMRRSLVFVALGMIAISLATPLASPRIFAKWFSLPEIILLAPLPLVTASLFGALWYVLDHLPAANDRHSALPFVMMAGIFALGFTGLAYSFYPYVVPDRLTIFEAASAPESLGIILVGVIVVLPVIIGYSIFAYRVFGGKASELRYD
ncbi:cytochrome d ubiquinol oxidase subunit II [Phyllobacterium sp. P30BS-XVII]|uniref:cytochrome d ubiquinol oxidase subunit II n=1 Tax=Phyllobacterium sp. P30BS-XVII TaxID=2587046 RepID=UPI0015FD27DB|nr:cytochrome d ubiquinol oxidase subunit II [Phyllobacterium sp. P30BS-XVII]MBA8899509.1 cytochrome d ubiquinol oxidase subunit II [Phyllobacterium sp. P30BS-XVII]